MEQSASEQAGLDALSMQLCAAPACELQEEDGERQLSWTGPGLCLCAAVALLMNLLCTVSCVLVILHFSAFPFPVPALPQRAQPAVVLGTGAPPSRWSPPQERSQGFKALTVAAGGGWQAVNSVPGAGVAKKIYIGLDCDPALMYLAIAFDGAERPQIGSWDARPSSRSSPSVDQLLTQSFGRHGIWISDSVSCAASGDGFMGCNWAFDMPFTDGMSLWLFNADTVDRQCWTTIFWAAQQPDTALRLHTQRVLVQAPAYPAEHPLLSARSEHGLLLKAVKLMFHGCTGNWVEGRVKLYSNGSAMTAAIDANHWVAGSDNQLPTGCFAPDGNCTDAATATVLHSSTGTEDFFLSAFFDDFQSDPPAMVSSYGGLLWANNNDSMSGFRVFHSGGADDSAPQAGPGEFFTVSYSVGDIRAGANGQCAQIVGDVWYYA